MPRRATYHHFGAFVVLILISIWASPVAAQWAEQQLNLRVGWNTVYLEEQPKPRDPEAVFAGLIVGSVWAPVEDASGEAPQNPENLEPGQGGWRQAYFPSGSSSASATNLHAVHCGLAYLVELKPAPPTGPWSVKGRPVVRPRRWKADSYNYVGFLVERAFRIVQGADVVADGFTITNGDAGTENGGAIA